MKDEQNAEALQIWFAAVETIAALCVGAVRGELTEVEQKKEERLSKAVGRAIKRGSVGLTSKRAERWVKFWSEILTGDKGDGQSLREREDV